MGKNATCGAGYEGLLAGEYWFCWESLAFPNSTSAAAGTKRVLPIFRDGMCPE